MKKHSWNERQAEEGRARTAALIEDIEFMLATGESAPIAAARVGHTIATLETRLKEAGRKDLAAVFGRERWRKSRAPS